MSFTEASDSDCASEAGKGISDRSKDKNGKFAFEAQKDILEDHPLDIKP